MAHTEMRKSRVLVAAAGLLLGLVAIWVRAGWLQIARHDWYEERAERNQEQRVPLRPTRGRLLDRGSRVLARDLLTYSVSAAPREMKDPRATARALADLLDQDPRKLTRAFTHRRRFQWVARRISPALAGRIAARHERGVHLTTEVQRIYPLGEAAAEIVGRTDLDGQGIDGLELQYDDDLRGLTGWTTLLRDGAGRSHPLPGAMRRRPEDGDDVVLTLDADLQTILETHLAAAVDSLRAVRGFAMFIDPRTGEVLASAVSPHLGPGKGRNWNFTDQFEPGSTYKVVVAAAALEERLVRPDQIFEASATGVATVVPGVQFHDVHKEARYTFRDAVRWSSNIVLGRLGLTVGAQRLYNYATSLGFGSITGVTFPGEAGGRLRSPEHWSARSTPTIAIGHELSVTPLQLTLAYAAIANGGVLMHPMLVREVREADGGVRRFSPEASRRVFSETTAAQLREMLTAVVDSGTAKAARVDGISIAGKTGTAQKYDASVGTYGKGQYLSSFIGFAPASDPRVVGVVVIDEPRGSRYYGGEVAAPVFREVIRDLMRVPEGPLGPGRLQVATRPPAPAPVAVPDLRMLPRSTAERRLAEAGLHARLAGEGARVLGQEPGAGAAVERGAAVTVWLSAPTDTGQAGLPDLVGLSVRAALRELNLRQVAVRIVGHGIVIRQDPPPGARLPLAGPCVLRCEPAPRTQARQGGQTPVRLAAAVGGAR